MDTDSSVGKRGGTTAAVGFIMPHITANYSFRDQDVLIDNIESATGISFMPLLAEPTPLEQTVDPRWLNN